MRATALLALTIALLACGPGTVSRQTAPTPTPSTAVTSPTASPAFSAAAALGVFTGSADDAPGHYSVRIVSAGGQIRASYLATVGGNEIPPRLIFGRIPVFLPTISLSETRAYFADGESQLRVLAADGSSSIVHQLPNVRGKTRAVFAVSPNASRIAIALFDWSVTPMTLRIYVEDLVGGGNRVEIFRSNSVYEWPVAWHNGDLVLAVNPVANASNPYGAGAYHVAKASDGTRLAVMGGLDCLVVGSLSPSGTACASNCDATTTCVEAVDWSGARSLIYRRPNDMGSGASWSALSPGGTAVTTGTQGPGDGVGTKAGVVLFAGNVVDLRNWWIDNGHVLGQLCFGVSLSNCTDAFGVIDVATGAALPTMVDRSGANPVGWFSANPGG
jgi:hypothetical protein